MVRLGVCLPRGKAHIDGRPQLAEAFGIKRHRRSHDDVGRVLPRARAVQKAKGHGDRGLQHIGQLVRRNDAADVEFLDEGQKDPKPKPANQGGK